MNQKLNKIKTLQLDSMATLTELAFAERKGQLVYVNGMKYSVQLIEPAEMKRDDNCPSMKFVLKCAIVVQNQPQIKRGELILNYNDDLTCSRYFWILAIFGQNGEPDTLANIIDMELFYNG